MDQNPSKPPRREDWRKLSPLGNSAPTRPTEVPELPRSHWIEPPSDETVPRWKKILAGVFRVGSAVAVPSGAAMAAPAIANVMVVSSQTNTEEIIRQSLNAHFSESNALAAVDAAIASQGESVGEREKGEFRQIVREAFRFLREQSADLAKDVVKDAAKTLVEIYVLSKVAGTIVDRLRSRKGNRIAQRFADILDRLWGHKKAHPEMPVTPEAVVERAGCSDSEAKAALQLGGYRREGPLWVPAIGDKPH